MRILLASVYFQFENCFVCIIPVFINYYPADTIIQHSTGQWRVSKCNTVLAIVCFKHLCIIYSVLSLEEAFVQKLFNRSGRLDWPNSIEFVKIAPKRRLEVMRPR